MMRIAAVGAAIFIGVALVFSSSVSDEFVNLDDYDYVVCNSNLQYGLTADAALWAVTNRGHAANWHPLTWMSHAADVSLATALGEDCRAKENTGFYFLEEKGLLPKVARIENVLLHALNAVLLYFVVLMVMGRCGAAVSSKPPYRGVALAAVCALFWAVHPLRVEAVAWVTERKELLSVFFLLLTVIAYVRGRVVVVEKSCTEEFSKFISLFTFTFSLLSKAVAVSLPVVIFAYEWVIRREAFWWSVRRALPYAVLSATVCVYTALAQAPAMHSADDWSLASRVIGVVESPIIYLGQTFWPVGLTIDYAIPDWSSWPVFAAGVALLAAMGAAVVAYLVGRWRGWRRGWLDTVVFAIAWVYVGLVPMIGIVKVGYEPHNDRFTYWIAAGASVILGAVLVRFPKVREVRRWGAWAAVVLAVLGIASFRLGRTWKDTETVYMRAVKANHDPYFAQMLAETIAVRHPERTEETVELLRDVLDRRHSPLARAVLAYQLATYAPGIRHATISGGETGAFTEARALAEYALEDWRVGHVVEFACAALAQADFREEKFEAALKWMDKAIEFGFKPEMHAIDIRKWKEKCRGKK